MSRTLQKMSIGGKSDWAYNSGGVYRNADLPSLAKEGGRASRRMARRNLWSARTGWFVQGNYSMVFGQTTPSAPSKEREHFLVGAATPPLPRRGDPPSMLLLW